jgi:kumamolisin
MAGKGLVELDKSYRGEDLTGFQVGKVPPNQKVTVTIGLRVSELKELKRRFSASQADADEVEKSLKKFNLKVEEVSLLTRNMRVSGTAKDMEAGFKPEWVLLRSPTQGYYRARKGTLKIPKELKEIVTGVFGLDQRQISRPRSGGALSAGMRAVLSKPWTPEVIEKYYKFPPGDGQGQTIAIAQFGGGFFEEDLKKYCDMNGLKFPNIQLIRVGAKAGAKVKKLKDILNIRNPEVRFQKVKESFEVMMDVELIVGLCPKANISVYFAENDHQGWIDLLNAVILAKPVALSISWGNAEKNWEESARLEINERLHQARDKGITTCVASGDDGCNNYCNDGFAHVDFPSSSPYVLAVGGTMMEKGTFREVAWSEYPVKNKIGPLGGGASGGGVSMHFRRPSWQKDVRVKLLNQNSRKGRMVPDVSALAGKPYYEMYFLQYPWPQGKTSASAPVWAALIARINALLPPKKQQRFLTPLLYREGKKGKLAGKTIGKTAFRSITKGNNAVDNLPKIYYKAGPGFDAVTGWGVPNGLKLLDCLKEI